MTRNINRGRLPTDLGFLIDDLNDVKERLRTLEAPDGNQLARTVAELQTLVSGIEATLTDFIENDVEAIVNAAITARLAGNISIGGTLSVAGAVYFPNVPATTFVVEPRTVTWVDTSTGRLGRT